MSGGVDKVELIFFAVGSGIVDGHGVRLDGDAALSFEVHIVENLVLHLALCDRIGEFKHSVGEGRLSVVDMGNYTKIANVVGGNGQIYHSKIY